MDCLNLIQYHFIWGTIKNDKSFLMDGRIKNITITIAMNILLFSSFFEGNPRNLPLKFIYYQTYVFQPLFLLLLFSFFLTTSGLKGVYGLLFCRKNRLDFYLGGRGSGEWMHSWCGDRISGVLPRYGVVWIVQEKGFGCVSLGRAASMLEYSTIFYQCLSASYILISAIIKFFIKNDKRLLTLSI